MGLDLYTGEYEWYVPAFGRNRERYLEGEEAEPCQLQIRVATYADSDRMGRLTRETEGKGLPADPNTRFLAEHVGEIRGLRVQGAEIQSGAELSKVARGLPAGFVGEIVSAILTWDRFDAGLKKKLPSPRGSRDSQPERDGTAATAVAEGST